jgi:uncharacterized C2H2 Zn-finger protein
MAIRSLLALALAVVLVSGAPAEDKEDTTVLKCPVSGKPVAAGTETAYRDGEIQFCCPGCPKAFAKDTAKFATKANMQLVSSGQYVQAKCPIAGRPVNPNTAISVAGLDVAFCCKNCKAKAEKAEGDAQADLVFGDKAFDKGFAKKAAEKK